MFRTYAAAEVLVPTSEDQLGTTLSTFVEVMGQRFWFIGTLSDPRAEDHVLRTFLVRDLEELKTIARGRGWDIIQVDIAVPPSDSQTGEWEFERLVAVWDCEDGRFADGIVRVYESIQGISYTDVVPEFEPFDRTALRRLRRVYPIRKVRHSQWSRARGRAQDDFGGTDGS